MTSAIFTCGYQDAGLGSVGSLLLLNLLTNEFRKANRAKVSTRKGGRKGLLAMTKPLVRSDLASEAIWRQKQPRRICLKKIRLFLIFSQRTKICLKKSGCSSVNEFSSNNETKWVQVSNISREKSPPPYFRRRSLRSGPC